MNLEDDIPLAEICNECGISVRFGSGIYANRVLDMNDYETRVEMGKPFPQGDFVCAICEEELRREADDN